MAADSNCNCSQHGDLECPEHPDCECGCQAHAHWKGDTTECIAGRVGCGCKKYRPRVRGIERSPDNPPERPMILHYQPIRDPSDLCIWEPREGHAIVACKVDAGRGVWEPRTYEFRKCASGGWLIQVGDSGPPYGRGSWAEVVHWLCLMRPIEIELVTTV